MEHRLKCNEVQWNLAITALSITELYLADNLYGPGDFPMFKHVKDTRFNIFPNNGFLPITDDLCMPVMHLNLPTTGFPQKIHYYIGICTK